jgi:predicted secreted protein
MGAGAMAVAQEVKEVVLGEEAAPLSVSLEPGSLLHVRLKALPSAGYVWRLLSANENVIVLEETRFEKGPGPAQGGEPPPAGGPAEQIFVFKAQKQGETGAVFAYGRPWETDRPPKRTATLNVKVGL